MHPSVSPDVCREKIIDSHTIQRKGPLAKIIDSSKHVYHLDRNYKTNTLEMQSLGWRKASTFPGFCSFHDTDLFKDLETEKCTGTKKQCVLQSFRTVCSELYKKRALIESLKHQRRTIDAGRDLHRQIEIQLSIRANIEGNKKSIEELEHLQSCFYHAIISESWGSFDSEVYFFEGELDLISTAVMQIDYDFEEKQYVDLFDLEQDAESITYSILDTESGGAIVFCWPKETEYLKCFVESFDRVRDENKSDIFVQYCFLSSENTFFSKIWWDKLSPEQHRQIFALYQCTFYNGGSFEPSELPLVGWKFESTKKKHHNDKN